ncbi:MAG: Fe(3+) ABC transporter substrate-binding protein [Leptolyngbyaceae bacterium]|nr:Fe(3+) ABC transporter substrate-binding protein [Leptolyngbyaceae bacterium]
MMKLTKRGFLAGLAGLTAIAAVSCSTAEVAPEEAAESSPETAEATGELNLYSSRHYDTDDALYEGFTEETGIEINLIEAEADELLSRIESEGENSPADILMTVDAGRLWRAEEMGLFQPVDSEALTAAIPENLRHPDGLWFGLTQRARVLVYNKETVDPAELSTYEDLADPKWKGRVCIRSSSNIYNQSLMGSMVESLGVEAAEEWAKGLVSNLAREPEGGDTDQIKAVAAGQCDVAVANHYYWARLAKSDDAAEQEIADQVGVFFPNQGDRGTHVNISGAGVLANAPNYENAVLFLEYLVTPEAQAIFAEGNNEYPVVEGVTTDEIVSGLGDFKIDTMNVAAYGGNNAEVVQIVDRAGWK